MIDFDPETHTYMLDGRKLVSVTQVLQATGFIDATWFTEYARERGTLVHRVIHWHIEGTLDEATIDPALQGYFSAFKKFQDEADIDTDTWTVEKQLASAIHGFAGTPDFVGIINGKCAVIDLKTSATVSPSEQLQTVAYQILLAENRHEVMPVTHRFSLHVSEDGKYRLIEHKDRTDKQIFMAALACCQWQINKGRKE